MRLDFNRGNIVIPVEIISVEQSILFGKKGVFSRRQGQVKIAALVRCDALDKFGADATIKSRFPYFAYLAEIGEFINIQNCLNSLGRA